jgi:tetratricopeptide (TPR) repeat protein
MKHLRVVAVAATLAFASVLPNIAIAQQGPPGGNPTNPAAQTIPSAVPEDGQSSSPAELRIAAAKLQIQVNPKKAQAYNDLALALARRARETDDSAYFRDAEDALAAGLSLAPNDFQLEKTHVALLLGEQQFGEAKKEATALNQQTPDDVTVYGYIAEADIALGDYHDAEVSAQWMLNLLPYNVPGLLIAAQLRELFGDAEGAMECLERAYAETSPNETEELAWIANQMASIEIDSGHPESAVRALDQAERVFPQYPYTRENRARAQLEQGNPSQAGSLLRQLRQTPHVLYELAKAESAAGHSRESERAYADFERSAKPLIHTPANANRELILYYADRAPSASAAQQALELARHEILLRHDVWTLDAYARALYANGKFDEADVQIEKALAVGIRSDQVFDDAGHIANAVKKQAKAEQYFEAVLQIHSSPEYSEDAHHQLAAVPTVAAPRPTAVTIPIGSSPSAEVNSSGEMKPVLLAANIPAAELSSIPASLLTPLPTGTERILQTMQHRVAVNPKEAGAYSGLGAAYLQRARETGDVEDYQLAEQSLSKSLDLVSTDLSATAPLATMAEVCMGEHRFDDALNYAQKALALGSGDLSPFAIVGDAYADMGEYEKAGVAYSRLSSDSVSEARTAYVRDARIAYLKFISGNTEDAIRLMKSAVTAGVEAQLKSENLAWLYFELGEFEFQNGNLKEANDAYLAALATHRGDYRALAGLGRLRADQGKYGEAILLYQKAIAVVPMPIYVAELGDVYTKVGNTAEAEKQYQLVEFIGLLGHINQVLHNRDLALFYADHDRNLNDALVLARKEFEVRHDIYTWDALAWALYKNGRYQESENAIDNALRFGTNDSLLLFHAGMIEAKLGNAARAHENLDRALKINPHFHILYADQARQELTLPEKQPIQTAKETSSDGQSHTQ